MFGEFRVTSVASFQLDSLVQEVEYIISKINCSNLPEAEYWLNK